MSLWSNIELAVASELARHPIFYGMALVVGTLMLAGLLIAIAFGWLIIA